MSFPSVFAAYANLYSHFSNYPHRVYSFIFFFYILEGLRSFVKFATDIKRFWMTLSENSISNLLDRSGLEKELVCFTFYYEDFCFLKLKFWSFTYLITTGPEKETVWSYLPQRTHCTQFSSYTFQNMLLKNIPGGYNMMLRWHHRLR